MARFGLTEDSDEEAVPVQNGTKILKEAEVTKDRSAGKGKGREVSPPMQVDELADPTRRRKAKRAPNALVESEGGETRYAHEVRARKSKEVSDEDEDEYNPRPNGKATISPVPWPAQIGLEPHRIHVMQTSLFRMPEEQAAFAANRQGTASTSKLKPRQHAEKLLNASAKLIRKHSRGSEGGGDSMRLDKTERASFDQSLDPEPYRPARKVARVQSGQSVCAGQDGAYVDAGLAFGRSFRVSWGPGGQLARICGLASSVVQIESIAMVTDDKDLEGNRASRLLEAQIDHSTIELDDSAVPVAFPSRSFNFSTFATLFPQHDNSHEAQIWRQGIALFDPLPQPTSNYIPPTIRPRLITIQRRAALENWLYETVASTVAAALRNDPSASPAQRSFIRLTGHQIEEAVDAAAADGNAYLSMLLSQAGGDTEFRIDLDNQLSIWAAEGSDRLVSEAYRKCLAVLSGATDVWRPPKGLANTQASEVNVVKGLDWKRAFGLALWYGAGSEGASGYEIALEQYEQTMGRDGASMPLPWYKESSGAIAGTATSLRNDSDDADALFELLRLAAAQIPLERAIYPRGFTSNSLDYRMTWHIYILLSRAMRIKDFSDRHRPEVDEFDSDYGVEGHSETADGITCAYAAQLEAIGQLQKAVFVLLHLEGGRGREKAVKELLLRQAHALEPWQIIGLQSFSIPIEWIEAALGCLAQYEGRTFDAYEHFLKADEQRLAHTLAVNDLAPDAIIRGDLSLLRALFQPFNPQVIDDWSFRGKLFLDYVDATERIPGLVAASRQHAVLDASDALELSRLKNTVPQLIRSLPDVFKDRSDPRQNAALSVMLSGLLLQYDSIRSKSGVQPEFDVDLVDEATRLRHIHNVAYSRFIQSVSAAA